MYLYLTPTTMESSISPQYQREFENTAAEMSEKGKGQGSSPYVNDNDSIDDDDDDSNNNENESDHDNNHHTRSSSMDTKKSGRAIAPIWNWFTNDPRPHASKSAICKHCNNRYNHHKKSEQAKRHLQKCKAFCDSMSKLDVEEQPEWFTNRNNNKRSRKNEAMATTPSVREYMLPTWTRTSSQIQFDRTIKGKKKGTIDSMMGIQTSSKALSEYHPNLILSPSKAHALLFTKIRDKTTSSPDFVKYTKRSMRILIEDALAEFPTTIWYIDTPCQNHVACTTNIAMNEPHMICAVSIIRSGDALIDIVRDIDSSICIGKILIQRDETTPDKAAQLYYSKLPPNIANMYILLCDPMLATGGSAILAIETLINTPYNVNPNKIIFANMICAPEGLQILAQQYPMIKIVTTCIDSHLNDDKYIVPGLGDYGDRYFNT